MKVEETVANYQPMKFKDVNLKMRLILTDEIIISIAMVEIEC